MAPKKKPKTNVKPETEGIEEIVSNSVDDYATYVAEWERKVKESKTPAESSFAERTLRYWQLALAYAKSKG